MPSVGHHIAIYNFGIHVAPYGDSAIDGFIRREPINFEAARRAIGFVGRSGYVGEPGPESWGTQVFPRFLKSSGRDAGPSSLSLWHDIESLMAFSYAGIHAEALKHARKWNVEQLWPALVLWWVPEDAQPEWTEAVRRFEHLHDHGPGPSAFHFKQPFDAHGQSYAIDRARVRAFTAANAVTQRDLMPLIAAIAP